MTPLETVFPKLRLPALPFAMVYVVLRLLKSKRPTWRWPSSFTVIDWLLFSQKKAASCGPLGTWKSSQFSVSPQVPSVDGYHCGHACQYITCSFTCVLAASCTIRPERAPSN